MSNISLVIVGKDELYLSSLEICLLKNMGDMVDITMITNDEYYNYFFSMPQKIDVLIIEENLYGQIVEKQNVGNIFVLEETKTNNLYKQNVMGIYKFSSVKEIFHKISGKIGSDFKEDNNKNEGTTQTIFVYSPIGGSGKTLLALSMCHELAEFNKHVLYINIETIQNFHWFLSSQEEVSDEFCYNLANHNANLIMNFASYVGNEGFDYIKPIHGSMLSFGIKKSDYFYLISELVQSQKYDYIIIDSNIDLDENNCKMMGLCDRVVSIVKQDALSVWKVDSYLENIDYSDSQKYLFVCNKFKADTRNYIVESEYLYECNITEYIGDYGTDMVLLREMTDNHSMKQTVMLML